MLTKYDPPIHKIKSADQLEANDKDDDVYLNKQL